MASLVEEYNKQEPCRKLNTILAAWDEQNSIQEDNVVKAVDFPKDNARKVIAMLQKQGLPIVWITMSDWRSIQFEWRLDPYFLSLEVFEKVVLTYSHCRYQNSKYKAIPSDHLDGLRWFLRKLRIILQRHGVQRKADIYDYFRYIKKPTGKYFVWHRGCDV